MNMKNLIFTVVVMTIFTFCSAPKPVQTYVSQYFWGEVVEENVYLYSADSLTAIVDGELAIGSIILFGNVKNDFQEIFLDNPKGGLFTYHAYKPKFRKVAAFTVNSNHMEKLLKAPIETNRTYIRGDRGGCYYLNSKGNRIYVDRGLCGTEVKTEVTTPTRNSSSNTNSSGGSINVQGHYRTSKTGKTIYVKPHTRKKN